MTVLDVHLANGAIRRFDADGYTLEDDSEFLAFQRNGEVIYRASRWDVKEVINADVNLVDVETIRESQDYNAL